MFFELTVGPNSVLMAALQPAPTPQPTQLPLTSY